TKGPGIRSIKRVGSRSLGAPHFSFRSGDEHDARPRPRHFHQRFNYKFVLLCNARQGHGTSVLQLPRKPILQRPYTPNVQFCVTKPLVQ
ncbi:Protein of unknown function, partial [Gryllus bimaculatus]